MPVDRLRGLRPTAVNAILKEVRALQAQGKTLVSLMRGEPDFPTAPHIVEAAVNALQAGRTSYPDNRGEEGLRQAVAQKLSRDNGLRYDPASEILITDGGTLGLYATLMTLLQPGDEILVPDPIYDAYHSPICLTGGEARRITSSRKGGRFGLTLKAIEAACTSKTRAILLNTPWNPVGTVLTREELEQISGFALRRNLTIISDEVYEALTYDGHKHVSPAVLSSEVRASCVVVNSLSKTYSMTGWRLGYCAAPKPMIDAMLLVLQQSSRGPATFIQDAGVAALSGPQDHVAKSLESYTCRRQKVADALRGIPNVEVLSPEGGFFSMIDTSRTGRSSDDVRRHLLYNHGLVLIHGSAYGEGGEGTLRVSFAKGGETLDSGLALLREGLRSL